MIQLYDNTGLVITSYKLQPITQSQYHSGYNTDIYRDLFTHIMPSMSMPKHSYLYNTSYVHVENFRNLGNHVWFEVVCV